MRSVLDRFLAQAAAQPDHPGVQETDAAISYGKLADRVRRLASAIAKGRQGPRVLIHLPQGADAYAAMFATAMAGGVYAPTNVGAPITKQRLVMQQLLPDVIVSTPALYTALT